MTVAEVATGLGVRPERVRRLLRRYADAELRDARNRLLLTERQVWGSVQLLGRSQKGLWYGLTRDQLERLIGIPRPSPLDELLKSKADTH